MQDTYRKELVAGDLAEFAISRALPFHHLVGTAADACYPVAEYAEASARLGYNDQSVFEAQFVVFEHDSTPSWISQLSSSTVQHLPHVRTILRSPMLAPTLI